MAHFWVGRLFGLGSRFFPSPSRAPLSPVEFVADSGVVCFGVELNEKPSPSNLGRFTSGF